MIEDQEHVFRGTIGSFSAANLGAHMLGGFTESFSALRICRMCMATKHDIQRKVRKSMIILVCVFTIFFFENVSMYH